MPPSTLSVPYLTADTQVSSYMVHFLPLSTLIKYVRWGLNPHHSVLKTDMLPLHHGRLTQLTNCGKPSRPVKYIDNIHVAETIFDQISNSYQEIGMKIRAISETIELDTEDIVEKLEDFVDTKSPLTSNDYQYLVTFLGQFNQVRLKKVAALLGTASITPEKIANEIIAGELLVPTTNTSSLDNNTADDLAALNEPGASRTDNQLEEYQNRPPAFPIQPGTPDPQTLPPTTLAKLANMDPASLIDSSYRPATHQPFIYVGGQYNKLFVGDADSYHDSIRMEINGPLSTIINNVYFGGDFDSNYNYVPDGAIPGVVGRIGFDCQRVSPNLAKATIVAMYAKEGSKDPRVVDAAAKALIKQGYVPSDAILLYAGKVGTLSDVIIANDDDRLAASLQSKYYINNWTPDIAKQFYDIGEWPNGVKMDSTEREFLTKKFKFGIKSRKNDWQRALEKTGTVSPGQRWWAPTSEGIE